MTDDTIRDELKNILAQFRSSLGCHTMAYAHLLDDNGDGTGSAIGGPKRLYSKEAEKIWREALNEDPDNWIACHHLAIMTHARAFDLELNQKVEQAHKHWVAAQKWWKKLLDREDGEPITSIFKLLETHPFYRADKHKDIPLLIAAGIQNGLLKLHDEMYHLYIGRKLEREAEFHLSAIERSPFAVSKQYVEDIHEQIIGKAVDKISREVILSKEDDNLPANHYAPQVEELKSRIDKMLAKRPQSSIILRDQIRLNTCLLNIDYKLDLNNFGILRNKISTMNRAMDNNTFDPTKRDDYDETWKTFKNLFQAPREQASRIHSQFSKLTTYGSSDHVRIAATWLSTVLQKVLDPQLEHLSKQLEAYGQLADESKRVNQSLSKYLKQSDTSTVDHQQAKAAPLTAMELWFSPNDPTKHNPYAITVFMLLGLAPPFLGEPTKLEDIIKVIKDKKKRAIKRARNNQLLAFGKPVNEGELNRIADLKDPINLAKDLLLQHQSHVADHTEVLSRLEAIPLPGPEAIALVPSAQIYSLLPPPKIDITRDLRWIAELPEEPPLPEPQMDWPY